jgi:Response regulators consisting of a CheY-like receiver domain and a winged-helix DNA-binding domain
MEKKRILIIEDDTAIAELERDYLEINGFEVVLRQNGARGLEIALSDHFDLIVLDLMLPEVDGFEICRKIRSVKDTPVLMISARKDDIDKIRGLGLGADDYLTKPFSPNEMVARVKAHISRYEKLVGTGRLERKAELAIRGLVINMDSRRVTLNGEEIPLTTKEYDLLLFLAQNPDHVFSKEALLDRVWGMEYFGDSATITVHVGKIRDKIEKDKNNEQFIETIWGVGYRFKV